MRPARPSRAACYGQLTVMLTAACSSISSMPSRCATPISRRVIGITPQPHPNPRPLSSVAMAGNEIHVRVPTADGAELHAELFLPAGDGPHPGVVVLHESFGLNQDIRRIARRFADAAYAALT